MAGGGRVEDHEVVAAGAAGVRRVSCASSQTLPIGQQLAQARASPRRGTANARLALSSSASGATGSWSSRYSRSAASGSIEVWCTPNASSTSRSRRAVLAAERARHVVARGDLGDDRAQAAARRRDAERGRDRRLADAALAGDDEQLVVEERAQRASGCMSSSPSQ